MTGDPKIRFPEAAKPDPEGWWPAAQCDAPGGLGDVSALPTLKDAGITHPPSAKLRPKVSVIKDNRVEIMGLPVLDQPVSVPQEPNQPPKEAKSARREAQPVPVVEIDHPPMMVTPSPVEPEGSEPSAPNNADEDVTGAIKVAFTKEESEAILRKPTEAVNTPQPVATGIDAAPQAAPTAPAPPVSPAPPAPTASPPVEPAEVPSPEQATNQQEAPTPPAEQHQPEPHQAAQEPVHTAPEAPPAEPAPSSQPPTPPREPAFVFDPKTMPISPPSPSIPGDDTDSLIVDSFTEADEDALAYSGPFSTVPPKSTGRWGRGAKERRQAQRYQQAIDRNLANTHAPLDVLFATERGEKPRLMALRPGFGRDFLVWIIAAVGVAQMLYRGWEILPTLNTFNSTVSDFQIQAAMSLMVGGALSGVLTLVAIRFITGMRSAFAWMASVFLVFGIFPWYGFGSQLSPNGLPPLPKPIDVVFNPVFDQNGILGITLIGLAICAIIALMTAIMAGSTRQN